MSRFALVILNASDLKLMLESQENLRGKTLSPF